MRILLVVTFCLAAATVARSQNFDMNEFDVFLNDTLIDKSDFLKNGSTLDSSRAKHLAFRPIKDGFRTIYFLNGGRASQGEIGDKKERGSWIFWHQNGVKAREGSFINGSRVGLHHYWYPDGKLRAKGSFKDDKYDGKWVLYSEVGKDSTVQWFKDGSQVK